MTAKPERQIIEANANIEVLVLPPGLSSLAIEAKAIEVLSIGVDAFINLDGSSGCLEFCSLRNKESVRKSDVCCCSTLKGSCESKLVECRGVASRWSKKGAADPGWKTYTDLARGVVDFL